jgi:hypothetical protein
MIFYKRSEAVRWKRMQPFPNKHFVVKDRHWSMKDNNWRKCYTVVYRP